MQLGDALKSAGVSDFQGLPGDIYLVEDTDVVIPETDKEHRKYHENGRPCVVLSNDSLCGEPMFPIVSIAPISHRVDLKERSDFPLKPTATNGLTADSVAMLAHIQPVKKTSLFKKIGSLSLDEWEDLIAHVVWNFDRV